MSIDGEAALIDNWQLQDVQHALAEGLQPGDAALIAIDKDQSHHWIRVPQAGIQLQCLVDLLLDIVLRERLWFETAYGETWGYPGTTELDCLVTSEILQPIDIPSRDHRILQRRDTLVGELCATDMLRKIHAENITSFAATGSSLHSHESSLIWGGAGNLARASALDMMASAHPCRRRLFEQTAFPITSIDYVRRTVEHLQKGRARFLREYSPDVEARAFAFDLQPIVAEVVLASADKSDLLANAIAARDQFRHVRQWLLEYQTAGLEQDIVKLAKHKKMLAAVERDAAGHVRQHGLGSTASVGITNVSVTLNTQAIADSVQSKFGVRAAFHRLVVGPRTEAALERLLGCSENGIQALDNQFVATFSK
jgi:hypothetical protein